MSAKSENNVVKFYVKRDRRNKPILNKESWLKEQNEKGKSVVYDIVGLLVGVKRGNEVFLGWSKKHWMDKHFDKKNAEELALRRAESLITRPRSQRKTVILNPTTKEPIKKEEAPFGVHGIPHSFREDVQHFIPRLKRYFKVEKVNI